ncbi:cytochrome P450 [Mycena vulgaris]|nr:cytochrome P450 [Mycena vulgaris]
MPPLPPGPRKLPLVGNLFSMPLHSEWETYWNAMRTSIVLLSSLEAAEDLLDKRSAIYSDRPRGHMLELMGGTFMFGMQLIHLIFRRHFHHELNAVSARRFRSLEIQQAHDLLRRMLDNPDCVGGIVMTMAYGLDTLPHDDPYFNLAHIALRVLSHAAVPGRFLIDVIPALKHLHQKRKGAEWKELVQEMVDQAFAASKDAMMSANGIERPSFITSRLLSRDGRTKMSLESQERDIKEVAATIYATGTDTTRTILLMFLRATPANPTAQKKAQQEIDAVIRSGHLPGFEDEDQLPYVTAVVKETMRMWPVAPIGYRIPAGSVVIANSWAMLHDESVCPEPHKFKPERFCSTANPLDIIFGFGRWSCLGRYMGLDSVWVMIASMLAVFNINKPIGEDGKVVEPPPGHISELVVVPAPFKCSIKPRSGYTAELIRSIAIM